MARARFLPQLSRSQNNVPLLLDSGVSGSHCFLNQREFPTARDASVPFCQMVKEDVLGGGDMGGTDLVAGSTATLAPCDPELLSTGRRSSFRGERVMATTEGCLSTLPSPGLGSCVSSLPEPAGHVTLQLIRLQGPPTTGGQEEAGAPHQETAGWPSPQDTGPRQPAASSGSSFLPFKNQHPSPDLLLANVA